MISSSENGGLEEDDFFAASPSSLSSASSISCHTPPPINASQQQQQQQQKTPRPAEESGFTKLSSGTGLTMPGLAGAATATSSSSGVSAALRRAPSPSRLNPVGATVVQDISDIRGTSPSRGAGNRSAGRASPSSGDIVISDMHIVDPNRRSPMSPMSNPASAVAGTSPKSFIDLHEQFGQPIVQQIQSRKSSSSAMSSASSEEYY